MKYYVDILYMIVNGVLISKDKNKVIVGEGLSKVIKRGDGVSTVKKGNELKSVRGSGLKILK